MATVSDLRERIDDRPVYHYDTKTCDGTTTKYQVSSYPIEPSSETITVGGSVFGTIAYTLNGTSGMLTISPAGANGTTLVAEYTCTQIDGTTLANILARNGNTLDLAAAEALEMRAAGAAAYFSFKSGETLVDKKGIAKEYRELAKTLRDNYYNPDYQAVVDTVVEWEYMDQEQTGD